jgi:molybdopterin-binding protein
VEITEGAVAALVKIDVGGGNHVTSTVTVEAIRELGLRKGQAVHAVIKASDIILAVDD